MVDGDAWMHACMHASLYGCMHASLYACIEMYIISHSITCVCLCVCMCVCACACVRARACVCACMHARTHACMHECMYTRVCEYVCARAPQFQILLELTTQHSTRHPTSLESSREIPSRAHPLPLHPLPLHPLPLRPPSRTTLNRNIPLCPSDSRYIRLSSCNACKRVVDLGLEVLGCLLRLAWPNVLEGREGGRERGSRGGGGVREGERQ